MTHRVESTLDTRKELDELIGRLSSEAVKYGGKCVPPIIKEHIVEIPSLGPPENTKRFLDGFDVGLAGTFTKTEGRDTFEPIADKMIQGSGKAVQIRIIPEGDKSLIGAFFWIVNPPIPR